jgi:excisionase family DNA binding protein
VGQEVAALERLLTVREVAERLGISRALAYRLVREEIPRVVIGRAAVRVRESDLDAYIRRRTQGGEGR